MVRLKLTLSWSKILLKINNGCVSAGKLTTLCKIMKFNIYQFWALLACLLLSQACGVQVSPGEIQLFTGNQPVVTPTPTPTPTVTPLPTATILPPMPAATPAYTIEQAAADIPPQNSAPGPVRAIPPPVTDPNSTTITQYIDDTTVNVMVDGIEYRLPYATLPPPPPYSPQPTPGIYWDARLSGLGVTLDRATSAPNQPVFRLISAQYKDSTEAGGFHHIYVEVVDENGQRLLNQPVAQTWPDGVAVGVTENKPAPEYAVNFPIYGVQGPDNYTIAVASYPSDIVNGLGLPGGQLVSYWLKFQRQPR